ncbi:MAG: glycosyltransferase [Acidobacteria bacterium]|nr:glycosyltransferase [Acidobacteriota bacterium]
MRVVHVWDAYAPSLFDRTHPYLLSHPPHASLLLAANLIANDAAVLPNTFHLATRAVDDDILPPLWVRARRRLRREFAEALRRLARSSAGTSIWSAAPLTLSLFNRFCLAHARPFHGDLIHAHFGTTGVMALPFIRATGLPSIVTFYGVDGSASLRIPRWRENFREMFAQVSRVLVLCDEVRDRLAGAGCPPEKLVVWNLPAGVEDHPYAPRDQDGAQVRFLIAARFVEKKGHKYLLEAFDTIVKAGLDARLTMIGYGPFKPQLQEAIARRRLADRVAIVDTALASGFGALYREALATHDIFVLPSTTGVNGDDEGGPALTMICAQAAGLPAICTPFPGAARSVDDGVSGLLCRQDDAASLAERMAWLARHREAWNAIGRAGSDRVRAGFSLDGQMGALLGIYQTVIDEAHGGAR